MLNKLISFSNEKVPSLHEIPTYRQKLLFISHGEPRFHGFGLGINISFSDKGKININEEMPDDPSTIYTKLLIKDFNSNQLIPKLPYFPSYSQMLPEQRFTYLKWLRDISEEIDIGYVFVYYYGLERHLIFGDFDTAFTEIILLRKYHTNSSFQGYSASALVHSCLLRKRLDVLKNLYDSRDFNYFCNSNLLILYYNELDILPDMMFKLTSHIQKVNRRYIKSNPEIYNEIIIRILVKKFGKPSYPLISRFSLNNVEGIPYPIFANISLNPDIRTPKLPNLIHYSPFQNEMSEFFQEVHETTKKELQIKRKNSVK